MAYRRVLVQAQACVPTEAALYLSSELLEILGRPLGRRHNETPRILTAPLQHLEPIKEVAAAVHTALTESGRPFTASMYEHTDVAPDANFLFARTWFREMDGGHVYALTTLNRYNYARDRRRMARLNNPLWWPFGMLHGDADVSELKQRREFVHELYPLK
jgi:hypothetical protein